jgi:hypothetical protein
MSTFDNLGRFIKSDSTGDWFQPANPEVVQSIVNWLSSNDRKPLPEELILNSSVSDWIASAESYERAMGVVDNRGIDTNWKPEVIESERRRRLEIAKNQTEQAIQRAIGVLSVYQNETLGEIKSRKFPLQFTAGQEAVASEQYGLAMSLPLKAINTTMLQSAWQVGRFDFVSACLERAGQAMGEFKRSEFNELSTFAKSYYEAIGVQGYRTYLKFLNALVEGLSYNLPVARLLGSSMPADYWMKQRMMKESYLGSVDNLNESIYWNETLELVK